jgi:predicted transcriptional regulator
MSKEVYHPNACLAGIRNVRLGLRARTKILDTLEKTTGDARTVAVQAGLTYAVAIHHLKLLRKSGVVQRSENKPYVWASTGFGQKRLVATS